MKPNKKNKQSANPVFSFVVDGKCELWYLQMLKENERICKIRLSPEIPSKKSLKAQYEKVVELAEECEKVFWVVDFDVIHKENREAKTGITTRPMQEFQKLYNKCKKNDKVIVIVNNPCFEFWFLLHFRYTERFYENFKTLLPDLRKHLADYEKTEKYFVRTTPDIYKRLKQNLQTAISNAEKLGKFDFRNTEKGMTEMYKIFRELKIEL